MWSEGKIIQLSPDAVTLERAKKIAHLRSWPLLEVSDQLIWGECKSSGTKTYQTVVQLQNGHSNCTCQETKHPCRHALGLLLLSTTKPHNFLSNYDPPEWVKELLQKEATSDKNKVVNEWQIAQEKDKRFALMLSGVIELETWLKDLIQGGLATLEGQTDRFWNDFAALMVNAKLGGIGRRIRQLKIKMEAENWNEYLLQEIADLYLFVKAFKRFDYQSEKIQQELLSIAGVNVKKDEVLSQKGIQDCWLVIAQREGEEENLRYRRTWLFGERSQRMALILDFAWGRTGYPMEWIVGSVLKGAVAFYPGPYPLRGLVKKYELSNQPFEGLHGFTNFETFANHYAEAIAMNPWLTIYPCLLDQVIPVLEKGELLLLDQKQMILPTQVRDTLIWRILGISGGKPISIFGEWDGMFLHPLATVADSRLLRLN